MPLALETKVPSGHGNGIKPRKQSGPAWRHTGRYGQQVRTGVSLLSCLVVIIRSHTDGPHLYHR